MPNTVTSASVQKDTIPKVQRAVVFETTNGEIKALNNHPVVQQKDLNPGEVLVRIVASGVCHTDLHVWKGDWPMPNKLPLVGGHEGAGYIAAIADNTNTDLKIGDAVGIKWMADSCLHCEDCRKTNESSCPSIKNHGFTHDGSFQQYAVSYANHVTPIPKDMSLTDAAPILCAGVTVYKALKSAAIGTGETVVITGAGGGLGHLAVQYAHLMGYRVIAVDSSESKKKLCESLGADVFIDFKDGDVVEAIKGVTNGGAHAAIVVASGAAAYNQALQYLRPNGALVAVGLPKDAAINAEIFPTVLRSLRIIGSYVGNRQDSIEALAIAAGGRVKTTYTVEPLENLASIYDRMQALKLDGRVILNCQ